jgi:hypothetical protein
MHIHARAHTHRFVYLEWRCFWYMDAQTGQNMQLSYVPIFTHVILSTVFFFNAENRRMFYNPVITI